MTFNTSTILDPGLSRMKEQGTCLESGTVYGRQIGNKIFQQRTPWVFSIFTSRGQSIQLIVPFYGLNEKIEQIAPIKNINLKTQS
jgi:hypothetical protein